MVSIRSNIWALLSVITRSDQLWVAALWYCACLCVVMAFFLLITLKLALSYAKYLRSFAFVNIPNKKDSPLRCVLKSDIRTFLF